jgi:hypothetical protein
MNRPIRALQALSIAVLAIGAASASATYPEKPIRRWCPSPPAAADFMARTLAQKLSGQLGQPVVLDHRGGAGGTIAAETVAAAAPDGYTLLFRTMGTQAINPHLYARLRYDPYKGVGVELGPLLLNTKRTTNPITIATTQPAQLRSNTLYAAAQHLRLHRLRFSGAENVAASNARRTPHPLGGGRSCVLKISACSADAATARRRNVM